MLAISVKSTLLLISMKIYISVLTMLGAGALRLDKTAIIIKLIINYT